MADQDMMQKILTIVVVPMLLLIGVVVYGNFEDSSLQTFEEEVTNETFSSVTPPEVVTLSQPSVVDNSETLFETFNSANTLTEGDNYTVLSNEDGRINVTVWNTSAGAESVSVDYTGHGGSGFTQVQSVNDNSYSGFDLAAVLPIVVAGVLVLGVVITAFLGFGA